MRHMLRVLNHTGDTELKFDPTDAAEVNAAAEKFRELIGQRHLAFALKDGQPIQVHTFDPAAEETILSPALVGG